MLKAVGDGWQTERLIGYEIESTLDKGADSFSFEVGTGEKGENAGLIVPGKNVRLLDSKGRQLLIGVIDEVEEGETIKVDGRDLMAYAIDAYPDSKRWKNAMPLDILKELAGQLAFTSVDISGVSSAQTALKAFQVEPGDSITDAFEKLAQEGDFELYVDPLGNLIATNMPDRPSSPQFNFISRIGEANCEIVLKKSTDDVYSTIKLAGRKAHPIVQTDSDISKYVTRTLTDRDGHSGSAAASSKKIAQMFREMKDRMRRWNVTFGGDPAKFGAVPKIGDGAMVTSYRHKINNEATVIWRVNLSLDERSGRKNEIELRSRAL